METQKVGMNLKIARIKSGLKVTRVAELLGVTKQTIYSYEKNGLNAPLGSLFKLAKIYCCNIKDFFD